MEDARAAVEAVFRRESGRIVAGLIRLAGSFDVAEEAMQEAMAAALVHWPAKGIPENPAAWITSAAQRKLIDYARRSRTRLEKQDEVARDLELRRSAGSGEESEDMNFPDDRLRLIFTCCHPALNAEAQVALTLRTLGGLTTTEIAKAFLLPEPTLAQRLVRAKKKIQTARIHMKFRRRSGCRNGWRRCRRCCISCLTKATRRARGTRWSGGSCAERRFGWRECCAS